jgi:hypothetical protein
VRLYLEGLSIAKSNKKNRKNLCNLTIAFLLKCAIIKLSNEGGMNMKLELSKTHIVTTRARMLNQFDEYIRNEIENENIINVWNDIGFPEYVTYDYLLEIAKDERAWLDKVTAFQTCCIMAGVITP